MRPSFAPLIGRRLQFGSTWLVTVSGWVVGHAAAQGMTTHQWAAAAVAMLGSISLAAYAHSKPQARQGG